MKEEQTLVLRGGAYRKHHCGEIAEPVARAKNKMCARSYGMNEDVGILRIYTS